MGQTDGSARVLRGRENRRRRLLVGLAIWWTTIVILSVPAAVLGVSGPDVLAAVLTGVVVVAISEFMPQIAEVRVAAEDLVVANSNDSQQIPRRQVRALLVPYFGLPSLALSDGTEVKLKGFGGGLWQRPQLRELVTELQVPLMRKRFGRPARDEHETWSARTT